MDMARHDHVTANSNIECAFGSMAKKDKGRMDIIASQACHSVMRAERDEVERTRRENPCHAKRSAAKSLHQSFVVTALCAV